MKNIQAFISYAVLAALAGCGEDDSKVSAERESSSQLQSTAKTAVPGNVMRHEMSSRDAVMAALKKRGILLGFDAERERMVVVETHGFSLKGEEKDDEFALAESYDFPDDANDDFETRRFKAMWKAYADGLARIATDFAATFDREKAEGEHGMEMLQSMSYRPLNGILTITSAESFENGEYEVTVAVGWSRKREKMYFSGLRGEKSAPGQCTLAEWIESHCATGIICPQSYCDNEGVWWRVAGVPVDLGAGRNSKKVTWLTEKAKHYAYEAAMRTIAVQVSARTSMSTIIYSGDDGKKKEKMEKSVAVKPMRAIRSDDPFRVKWLELEKVKPITGKPIRLIVCAIRDDVGARDAERKFFEEQRTKERQEAYERGRRAAEELILKKRMIKFNEPDAQSKHLRFCVTGSFSQKSNH